MQLVGKLYAESPIYRGNARKTLFTRDGDGTQRLVSLAGEIAGTAQSLMDAFIGMSRDGRNKGLIDQLWERLYETPLPKQLIQSVSCQLNPGCYPKDRFFDLRMGIRLDEDRAAVEANANYKYETLFRHSVFDFSMLVNDKILKEGNHAAKLYYLLRELSEGRFWFGAGKTKGLGRCRLVLSLPFEAPDPPLPINPKANHLEISIDFDANNPILVGWNWGKLNPEMPAFQSVDGRTLVSAMRNLPETVRKRLESLLAGPILNPKDWKRRFAEYLPKVIAIWLQEGSRKETKTWMLPAAAVAKLAKGKHPLSKKVVKALETVVDRPYDSADALQQALRQTLGANANMIDRILKGAETRKQTLYGVDPEYWRELVMGFGLKEALPESISTHIQNEHALTVALIQELHPVFSVLFTQIDQQIRLAQSDTWVEMEFTNREDHLRIKEMLLNGSIGEDHWGDPLDVPEGVAASTWREFTESHKRVRFQHMLNERNLNKSITNDRNFIACVHAYRERVRQELAQPDHIDFRPGGAGNRTYSKTFGKPYDNVFMRMLCWEPSTSGEPKWSIYIPGSTIKGAFRKRASQLLKTLWGEGADVEQALGRLFGEQGKRGILFFSDAYIVDDTTSERHWCVMDGVRMDPKTGGPIEEAKADYLFAFGHRIRFRMQLEIQDIQQEDERFWTILKHLFRDFQNGDISLGGLKTSGFGWVQARIRQLTWLTGDPKGVGRFIVGDAPVIRDGIWYKTELGEATATRLLTTGDALSGSRTTPAAPPRAQAGFISHRAFGGYCGTLCVEAEVLSPTCIRESGEPSFQITLPEGQTNGWDFFSMSPAEASCKGEERIYALPSKTIKGTIRHIYSIVSDSRNESTDITRLNPADSLFGWVGNGPNQALMGRLSVSFAPFENPSLSWFKVPYPYGDWQYLDGKWKKTDQRFVKPILIEKTWRVFRHVPLPDFVTRLDGFQPDTFQASYFRAMNPGSRARFTIRFWNLTPEELQRLIWSITLEADMAHKVGSGRYLGFGGIRMHLLADSHLIDWKARYEGKPDSIWKRPLPADSWKNIDILSHYEKLRKTLHAE